MFILLVEKELILSKPNCDKEYFFQFSSRTQELCGIYISNFLFADGNKFSDGNSFKNSNKEIIHYYLDSSESLHIHSYKDEISELLILHQNESTNKKSLIITSKDYLYRFLYTDDYLLHKVTE